MAENLIQSDRWCFTINNYTEDDVNIIDAIWGNPINLCTYLVYGREEGADGTPHLQGYITFSNRKRRGLVVRLLGGRCYVEKANGNNKQNYDYCTKDQDFREFGTLPTDEKKKQGKRTDLDKFKDAVKGGERNKKVLREKHSKVAAQFPRFFNDFINDNTPANEVEDKRLRIWQADIHQRLEQEPDDRTILFIVDTIGNAGKSWFSHWYRTRNENTQIIVPGKKLDMAYILIPEPRVLFFDCPRSKQGEFIQYDFLEECKNGYVFSGKYDSTLKEFKPPHVVVFMNEQPDMTKLSEDRYVIKDLVPEDNGLSAIQIPEVQAAAAINQE